MERVLNVTREHGLRYELHSAHFLINECSVPVPNN